MGSIEHTLVLPMSSSFNTLYLEGHFKLSQGQSIVRKDNGEEVCLLDILKPLLNHRVHFAIHHLPPKGIEADKPGLGSCFHPDGKGCPAKHATHPHRLLSFHLDGTLKSNPLRVVKLDGIEVPVPLAGMYGHYGRLAAATILDIDQMRDSLKDLDLESMAPNGVPAEDLKKLLGQLTQNLDGSK